ncbi:MAG: PIN domain-containing protein [Candidatus Micrarchaeota archaeon]
MIDSSCWIAYLYNRDEKHESALQLLPIFLKNKRHMTDYAIIEVANFLLRKSGAHASREAFELLTSSQKQEVIYNDKLSFNATKEIHSKSPELSFTDANMILHMQRLGLKEILSFDAGFDKVSGIKRIK